MMNHVNRLHSIIIRAKSINDILYQRTMGCGLNTSAFFSNSSQISKNTSDYIAIEDK